MVSLPRLKKPNVLAAGGGVSVATAFAGLMTTAAVFSVLSMLAYSEAGS